MTVSSARFFRNALLQGSKRTRKGCGYNLQPHEMAGIQRHLVSKRILDAFNMSLIIQALQLGIGLSGAIIYALEGVRGLRSQPGERGSSTDV